MSFKLCKILGVELHLHYTSLIVLILLALMMPNHLLLVAVLLVSVIAHEYGHVLAARKYGIGCDRVLITPVGGIAFLENLPRDSTLELIIVGAGPAVSLLLSLWGAALFLIEPFDVFMFLGMLNGALFLFNILPIFPMDGGRILRAVLSYSMSYENSTRISTRIGQCMAFVVGILSLFSANFMLFFAMVMVAMMGQKELDQINKV